MQFLTSLKDSFRGRTLLVVSCGPSASKWREVRSHLPSDTVVACIKQAIFLCKSEASLHFFNPYNCHRYHPHNKTALKIFVTNATAPLCFNAADIRFTLDPNTLGDLSKSIAYTGRFEDYTIENSGLTRCWGPGIMYDVVFHLAIFLGFRDIHTIGWDVVTEPENKYADTPIPHFYDRETDAERNLKYEWEAANRTLYTLKALKRHFFGQIYHRVPKLDLGGEVSAIVRSLPRLFEWLQGKGVSLTIHSEGQYEGMDDGKLRGYFVGFEPARTISLESAAVLRDIFIADWYLLKNQDVVVAGTDPFEHYVRWGAIEGRSPHPVFDTDWYLETNPSADPRSDPFTHYLTRGAAAGRDPHPLFDSVWYLEQNPDVAAAGLNPLVHYLMAGALEGRDPHPLFDSDWYLQQNQDVAAAGLNPLVHYLALGRCAGPRSSSVIRQRLVLAAKPRCSHCWSQPARPLPALGEYFI